VVEVGELAGAKDSTGKLNGVAEIQSKRAMQTKPAASSQISFLMPTLGEQMDPR
jgi:hypothetical protein